MHSGLGLKKDYVVFGLKPIEEEKETVYAIDLNNTSPSVINKQRSMVYEKEIEDKHKGKDK